MSRIEEMIRELCPNGVEFKRIGEIAKCCAGATPKTTVREYWDNGTIPWMSSGEVNYGEVFDTEKKITQLGYDKSSTKLVPPNTVVIALAGQGKTRGTVAITRIELCTNQSLCSIITNESINSDFLYHYLRSRYQDLRQISSGDGTRGGLNLKMIANYIVPVPPLEIQNEIVNILDKFTELEAELEAKLEAELEARQKQYEYYRNKLLNFSKFGGGISESVKWCKLGDLGFFYGGLTGKSKNDFVDGNAKFVTYMNVYSNIAIDTDIHDLVKIADGEKQNKIEYGDVVFTGSSETPDDCGMSSVLTAEPADNLYLNSFCFGFRLHDKTMLLPDFMKFLFRSENIRKQITRTASGVTRFNVSKKRFGEIVIPIPQMEEQQRIITILNKFETLVNDISEGLPAEISARRQQYEYYRDKLLTFKRKDDGKIQPCS